MSVLFLCLHEAPWHIKCRLGPARPQEARLRFLLGYTNVDVFVSALRSHSDRRHQSAGRPACLCSGRQTRRGQEADFPEATAGTQAMASWGPSEVRLCRSCVRAGSRLIRFSFPPRLWELTRIDMKLRVKVKIILEVYFIK